MTINRFLLIALLLLLPRLALAQCAQGLLSNCPAATSLQNTDVLYGWQFGQSPHSRSITPPQIVGAGISVSLVSGLPACNASMKYKLAIVSDANSPSWGGILSGSGTVATLAMCNGTNWVAM